MLFGVNQAHSRKMLRLVSVTLVSSAWKLNAGGSRLDGLPALGLESGDAGGAQDASHGL